MTKLIETAALVLGGVSLFAVAFVGFTVFSGASLNEVAFIGPLLAEPEAEPEHAAEPTATEEVHATRPRTEHDVIESSLGTLSAWTLPAPFTHSELRALSDELEARLERLDLRETELDQRSGQIEEDRETIAERYASLDEMQKDLEAFKAELILREQEVLRDEGAASERENARWISVARVIAGLEDEVAARRLTSFPPEEAAAVLVAMDETRASEVLNQLEGEAWKAYVEAYTDARARAEAGSGKR